MRHLTVTFLTVIFGIFNYFDWTNHSEYTQGHPQPAQYGRKKQKAQVEQP
jgi:hypothetical protein